MIKVAYQMGRSRQVVGVFTSALSRIDPLPLSRRSPSSRSGLNVSSSDVPSLCFMRFATRSGPLFLTSAAVAKRRLPCYRGGKADRTWSPKRPRR